ncbi:MAG: hypothetical protein QM770_04675 [Tepidisphaeraceae bacterium]
MRGIRIGQILVEQGLMTQSQVDHVLATQRRSGRPFGDLAERLFGVSPKAVEDAWVKQYAQLTQIDLADLNDIDPATAKLVNRRQAWQFHVIPIGRADGELVLLTDQEHLIRTINFAAATFKEPVFCKTTDTATLRKLLMQIYPVPQHLADFACQNLHTGAPVHA